MGNTIPHKRTDLCTPILVLSSLLSKNVVHVVPYCLFVCEKGIPPLKSFKLSSSFTEITVLIESSSNEGSGESVHMHSLVRAFAARSDQNF